MSNSVKVQLRSERHINLFWLGLIAVIPVLFDRSFGGNEFFLFGFLAYFVVQLLFPLCRLNIVHLLCPANIALAWFTIRIILIPIIIIFGGVRYGTLPYAPPNDAVIYGHIISVVAFVVYAIVFQSVTFKPKKRAPVLDRESNILPVVYLILGVIGIVLYFGSIEKFLVFLTDTSSLRLILDRPETDDVTVTLINFLGNILRPFLGFGFLIFASKFLKGTHYISFLGALLISFVIFIADFHYNRAYWLWPLVAFWAALNKHNRKNFSFRIVILGLLILPLIIVQQVYRMSNLTLNDLFNGTFSQMESNFDVGNFLQVYGAGPQFTGFVVYETDYGKKLLLGSSLVPSLLYPIPLIGKPLRAASGVVFYNRLIYQSSNVVDQVIPFEAELFANYHFVGVVLGFVALAIAIKWLQTRFENATSLIRSYCYCLAGTWFSFLIVGSIAAVSQNFFYFFYSIYLYFPLASLRRANHDATAGMPLSDRETSQHDDVSKQSDSEIIELPIHRKRFERRLQPEVRSRIRP